MVRRDVVEHPRQWPWVGYHEIMGLRSHHRLIDLERLSWRVGAASLEELRKHLEEGLVEALARDEVRRESCWTETLAVESRPFVEKIQCSRASRRQTEVLRAGSETWMLKETAPVYAQKPGRKRSGKPHS